MDVEEMQKRVRWAEKDADRRSSLRDKLISTREAKGLSRTKVAQIMQVSRDNVDDFENGKTDPRLSFLQRYARAVDTELFPSLNTAR